MAFGGTKAMEVVENYIYGTKDFRVPLDEAMALVGLQIEEQENIDFFASRLGIKAIVQQGEFQVKQVQLGAVADTLKIAVGDIILTIDKQKITKELLESLMSKNRVMLNLKRRFETIDIEVVLDTISYYPKYKIVPTEKISDRQKMLLGEWLGLP